LLKLGTITGLILVIAFFLPWVRACGQDVNGYALATSEGWLENPWLLWTTVVVGLFCTLLFFVARSDTTQARIRVGITRLIAAFIGILSLVESWSLLRKAGGSLGDLLFGGWLLALGYIGLFASSLMDITAREGKVDLPTPVLEPPSSPTHPELSPPPTQPAAPRTAYCSNCGRQAKPNARFCMYCGQQLEVE